MKKALKYLARGIAGFSAVVAALALFIEIDGIPHYVLKGVPDVHVELTPERIARGRELATLTCAGCHENPKTRALTGKRMSDLPPEFGVAYAPNITRHPVHGIGSWTDGQIEYLLRTGVKPDGQYVPPWMVKLPHASDEDLHSIVAFLRSDDPMVAPNEGGPGGVSRPSFLAKALSHVVFRPLPMPSAPITAPPRTDKVAYGRYMLVTLDCYSCHSSDFKKVDMLAPEKTPGYLGGGNVLTDADGARIFSANITPDVETGIGSWSEADFVRALKKGFRPDGRVLHYPMEARPALGDDEAAAIYAYLRTVPKIRNRVPRPVEPEASSDGARAYAKYGCPSCHGEKGVGLDGAADLRGANEHYPSDVALRAWIDGAPELEPGTRMPGWKGVIREEDYAPLIAHVRELARAPTEASLGFEGHGTSSPTP